MKTLGCTRNRVGESPLWSVAEQALYWVDIEARCLHRFDGASGTEQSWSMAERIGCIALHASGGLIAGMETGLFHLKPGLDGVYASEPLYAASFPREGMRFNDGRCDRQGRFLAGSMFMNMAASEGEGSLYSFQNRSDKSGQLIKLLDGFKTANGMAFSPDGRTMYLSDSHPSVQMVWAFDYDPATGMPSRRRVFADMNLLPGRPDGAAVDAEGGYWICGNDAGLVHRFTPDGRLDRSLAVPVSKPSMCTFGGPTMDDLFITSIQPGKPVDGFDAALDGAVFVTQPGVRGLPETPFQPQG
jgi:sugar lactone lactonase YvrE